MPNKSIYYYGLIVVTSFCTALVTKAQDNQDEKDFYIAIAEHGQQVHLNRPMETIQPVLLSDSCLLKWSGNKLNQFQPAKHIENKKEMNLALNSLKEHYKPFLKNLVPPIHEIRHRLSIDKMQFRYEQTEDCKDFNRLLTGEGDWDTVNIPYYHGPQGISTAWYRTEINIPEDYFKNPALMLHFNGADYYTDAYINGHHVGYHEGMLDEFEFNITKYAHPGKNVLLIKLRNDYSLLGGEGTPRYWGHKFAASNSPGWDDPFTGWTCCPAGYGIYQDLYIESRSTPYIADIYCRPLIKESAVELWTEIELDNGEKADDFILEYSLFGQNFKAVITKEKQKEIRVEGGRVLNKTLIQIPKEHLRLWNPDTPWLYQMQVSLLNKDRKTLLDNQKCQFGMREFVISETSIPKGRMYLNSNEIRLRGTNTMGFLQKDVMSHDWEQLIDDLLLTKLTNMNFIRTTQRIVQKEVYEYADKLGIMMQADLPMFAYLNQKQYTEILKQADNIERVLRNHPSVIMMTYMNEPMAEAKAHAISRYAYEQLFDALDIVVHNQNPERAIKYIDGDYQAPSNGFPDNHCYNIWYDGHGIELPVMCRGGWMPISKGWMYGCGEFGAEGLDPVDLMIRRYPDEWKQKEADGSWTPRHMRGKHQGEQTYGKHWDWFETQTNMKDWVNESQEHQAWGVKKVARAYRRMPRMNSFAVHLFIDAWPNCWMKAIMDCERTPKKAWFEYRDALTPLAVQIETERSRFFSGDKYPFQVWICNDTQETPETVLKYTLELDGKVIDSGTCNAHVPTVSEGSRFQGLLPVEMPKVKKRSRLSLRVGLFNKKGEILHDDCVDCSLYPSVKSNNDVSVYLLGNDDDSKAICKVFNIKESNIRKQGKFYAHEVILVTDGKQLIDKAAELKETVSKGARVVVLNDAIEALTDFMPEIEVNKKEDHRWIVFRNPDHRWVKGSNSTDLKYSYSSVDSIPKRYSFQQITAEGFTPVLTSHQKIILGEKKEGQGSWVICSLKLNGFLDTTPLLTQIFDNILNKK